MARKTAKELMEENAKNETGKVTESKEPETKEKKITISTVAPKSMVKKIDSFALIRDVTRADIILSALEEFLECHEITEKDKQAFWERRGI